MVGLGAGLLSVAFFAGSELLQNLMLEQLAGYEPLRSAGDKMWGSPPSATAHLWLLVIIPALGALVAGLLTRFAPECRGGGGDATIDAFHHDDGVIRGACCGSSRWRRSRRSAAAAAGGREGPTMQIGGALGSTGRPLSQGQRPRAPRADGRRHRRRNLGGVPRAARRRADRDRDAVSRRLRVGGADPERARVGGRVLGLDLAARRGNSSSVTCRRYPFRPGQIPLYIGLAIAVSAAASLFVGTLRLAQQISRRMRVPEWVRPAIGGLSLGVFVTGFLYWVGPMVGHAHSGLGILGGGYGAAQVAIIGADWLPQTWRGVEILILLALVKIFASALTIGSGGSAGDFAPALAIGGLLGGAFGLAAQIVTGDPTISVGAFALVGMGTFYGGIANTPLAALVLVCEIAGSYELLVPLMLAEGVAFVALRKVSLYTSQVPTLRDSPAHRHDSDPLIRLRCSDVVRRDRVFLKFAPETRVPELTAQIAGAADQDVFPIVDAAGVLRGIVAAESLRVIASNPELHQIAVAADLMMPPVSVPLDADLRSAAQLMLARDVRSLPVVDATGTIVGLLDEHDISAVALADPAQTIGA